MENFTFIKPDVAKKCADEFRAVQLKQQQEDEERSKKIKERERQIIEKITAEEKAKRKESKIVRIVQSIENMVKNISPLTQIFMYEFDEFYNTNTYPIIHQIVDDISLVMNAVGFKTSVCDKLTNSNRLYLRLDVDNPIYFPRISEFDNPSILSKPAAEFSDNFTIKKLYESFDETVKKGEIDFCNSINAVLARPDAYTALYDKSLTKIKINCRYYSVFKDSVGYINANINISAQKTIELLKSQGYTISDIKERKMPGDCHFKTIVESFTIELK